MSICKYSLRVILSLLVTLSALFPINLLAPLFMDGAGNLPRWLTWYQPSDNPAWGDKLWRDEHPHYSDYKLAVSYLYRNPAQGFDQYLRAKVAMDTPCTVRGNIDIADGEDGVAGWYLITTEGDYFHFAYVYDRGNGKCWTGGLGWRLNNIAKKYDHPTMGQYVFTPIRSQDFGGTV